MRLPEARDRYGNLIEPGCIIARGDGKWAAAVVVAEIKYWQTGPLSGRPYVRGFRKLSWKIDFDFVTVNHPERCIMLHPDHVPQDHRDRAEIYRTRSRREADQHGTIYDPEDEA